MKDQCSQLERERSLQGKQEELGVSGAAGSVMLSLCRGDSNTVDRR